MPSKSKSQQRFFGMVDAYKKGEMKNASSKIKKAANGMSMSDVKDFAETKHKGLPEKVEEQTIIRLTESDLHNIVKDTVNKILKEADRHRPGYWKERWAKQKAEKTSSETTTSKQKKTVKKDRHRPGYYREYNKLHPERLNRGFTKGYKNGCVSDGAISNNQIGMEIEPGVYIRGYDELGRPVTNSPLSDLLRNKEMEWHDDDWDEGSWDD